MFHRRSADDLRRLLQRANREDAELHSFLLKLEGGVPENFLDQYQKFVRRLLAEIKKEHDKRTHDRHETIARKRDERKVRIKAERAQRREDTAWENNR